MTTVLAGCVASVSLLRWSTTVLVDALNGLHTMMVRVLEMIPGRFVLTVDGAPVGALWFGSVAGAVSYAQAEYLPFQ